MWWSPRPGDAYLSDAWSNIGAFNLWWFITGQVPKDNPFYREQLSQNIGTWTYMKTISGLIVEDYELGEWAVVYHPLEFRELLARNTARITSGSVLLKSFERRLHMHRT